MRFNHMMTLTTMLMITACGSDDSSSDAYKSDYPYTSSTSGGTYSGGYPSTEPAKADPTYISSGAGFVDCSANTNYYSYYSNTPKNCFYVDVDVEMGAADVANASQRIIDIDGRMIPVEEFWDSAQRILESARLAAGDKSWNQDFALPLRRSSVSFKLTSFQGGTNALDRSGNSDLDQMKISSSQFKIDTTGSKLTVNLEVEIKISDFCMIMKGVPQTFEPNRRTKMSLAFSSFQTKVFAKNCVTPLPQVINLANVVAKLKYGASKSDVERIMGVSGLTVTQNNIWLWNGESRSPGCQTDYGDCYIIFDGAGKVNAVTGINPSYLDLLTW